MPGLAVADGLGRAGQRVGPADVGDNLACSGQLARHAEVGLAVLGDVYGQAGCRPRSQRPPSSRTRSFLKDVGAVQLAMLLQARPAGGCSGLQRNAVMMCYRNRSDTLTHRPCRLYMLLLLPGVVRTETAQLRTAGMPTAA